MRNQDLSATVDRFRGDYNIDTPESVAFDYTIADIGNRFLAALLDMFLVVVALVGLNLVLAALLRALNVDLNFLSLDRGGAGWGVGLVIALYAILNFLVFWGYFMLLELKWNGQTLGKQALKIRVVRLDGSPAGAGEIAVRNLIRIIDFMPSGYVVGLAVMLTNSQARRLGDLAAGTLVVKADVRVTLDQLVQTALAAASKPQQAVAGPLAAGFGVTQDQTGAAETAVSVQASSALEVRGVRPADYSLILDVLGRDAANPLQDALLVRLATAIALKIGYTADVSGNPRRFLQEVADAYRRKG